MKMKTHKAVSIGRYCKQFRVNVLRITLLELSDETNIKTLSGFEHGRSTNLLHVFNYLNACETQKMRSNFLQGLVELLEGLE